MKSNGKTTVITLGEQILHKTFGKGKIVGVKKEGSLMITVQFDSNGRKKDFIYPHPAIQIGDKEVEKTQTIPSGASTTSPCVSHANDKKILRTVYVDKNYKFLNSVFGLSYKGYYKSVWPYYGNQDLIVWMVPFRSSGDVWKNELLQQNGMLVARETYVGHGNTWAGMPLTRENIVGKIRVVVGKEKGCFCIYGVFKLGAESTGKCRIWEKIPDDVACKMVPEIFE